MAGFQPLIESLDDKLVQISINSPAPTANSERSQNEEINVFRIGLRKIATPIKPIVWRARNRLYRAITGPYGVLPIMFRFVPFQIFRAKLANLWFGCLGIDYLDSAPVILRTIKEGKLPLDVVLCHDYYTLPLGIRLAREFHAPISVDLHEHAPSQYAHESGWTTFISPLIAMKESELLKNVVAVTTVSDGIRDVLNATHELKSPAVTVRSVPFYEKVIPREPDGRVRILYSGSICEGRNLEGLVLALARSPERFELTFRGSESGIGFKDKLLALAGQEGVSDRFTILDPVPFHEIIVDSANFDIGISVPIDTGIQRRFTLPNKLFDYIMSGLAICVTDLPDMRRVVEKFECGELVRDGRPESIAETLLSISGERLQTYKARSLKAAKRLNWEKEESIFIDVVTHMMEA